MLINEPEQINDLTLEQLESDEVCQELQTWADSFKESARFDSDAVQIRRALESKLNLLEAGEELKTHYAPILLACKWSGLFISDDYHRAELVKTQLVEAYKNNIDVKTLLDDYFTITQDILFDHLEHQKIVQAMRENQELLGGRSLGSWLTRFAAFGQQEKRSGTLERLNFVNNNPETKNIQKEEKDILLKILEVLDFLEYPDEAKEKADWDVIMADKKRGEKRMKMAEFDELLQQQKTGAFPQPDETRRTETRRASVAPSSKKSTEDMQNDILKNDFTPVQCAEYLRSHFPEPVDFKQVLKVLNALNREGHARYMEIIYFDQAEGKFHWKEF